jgi:hypothetical protein
MSQRRFDFRQAQFARTDDGSFDMAINGSATNRTFRVEAPAGETWYGYGVGLMLQDETGWASDQFGGLTALSVGVRMRKRRKSPGEDIWAWILKRNNDLLERMQLHSMTDFNNSQTVAFFRLDAWGDVAFRVTDNEVLDIAIRDDLTGLSKMRAHLLYGILS